MLPPSLLAWFAIAVCAAASEAEPPESLTGSASVPNADLEEAPAELAKPEPVVQTWIGTLAVLGSRKVPLLGKVEFRTDTYVIAKATLMGPVWIIEQNTCLVIFKKVAGAKISLDEKAPRNMPVANYTWFPGEEEWMAGPWLSGWNSDDHDNDGHPGITFRVQAPFCGGELYIGSAASQTARGKPGRGRVVEGTLEIHVEQSILGARGPCLILMARDTKEWMRGQFAFVQVEDDATCDSIKDERFPDPMVEGD